VKAFRRQRQQYVFGGLLGVIAVVNVLFFLILYQPTRSEYFRLRESIQRTRAESESRRSKIDRLEKLSTQLETLAQDRSRLFTMHFIPRNAGWSETLPLLENAVQKSGVKNLRQDYGIEDAPQYGLYSVKIKLPVSGRYPNIVNFIKELEASPTFFIINSIDVRGSTTPGNSEVAMTLSLETFFYQ
jgi:Tfp pilus assembly protein PilO